MSEGLFNELSEISGFNALNGDTYHAHIMKVIAKSEEISDAIKSLIQYTEKVDDALGILHDNNVSYTHDIVKYRRSP